MTLQVNHLADLVRAAYQGHEHSIEVLASITSSSHTSTSSIAANLPLSLSLRNEVVLRGEIAATMQLTPSITHKAQRINYTGQYQNRARSTLQPVTSSRGDVDSACDAKLALVKRPRAESSRCYVSACDSAQHDVPQVPLPWRYPELPSFSSEYKAGIGEAAVSANTAIMLLHFPRHVRSAMPILLQFLNSHCH